MFARRVLMGSAFAAVSAAAALAQSKPVYTAVLSSDSLDILSPAISPNRKWVVFTVRPIDKSRSRLMIVSSTGGAPRALTTGGYNDVQPVWFPAGDRIVFRSSRVADGLMTLRIDPNAGEGVGIPQRLTLQAVQPYGFAPSPDGKSVFFTTSLANDAGLLELMVVPARGGNARRLATTPKGRVVQAWWPHPDSIFYSFLEGPPPSSRFSAWYVPARGGAPRQITSSDERQGFTILAPRYLLRGAALRIGGDTLGTVSVVSLRGDTLSRFDTRGSVESPALNKRVRPSEDGRTIMLAALTSNEATRILPVGEIGAPRDLVPPSKEWFMNAAYPFAFTPDGSAAWIHVRGEGQVMKLVPLNGGQARTIPLPTDALWPSPTESGRYIYVWGGHPADSARSLHIVDVASGRAELISPAAGEIPPGEAGDELYYTESVRDGALDVRRWSPGKGSILVQRIPPGRFYQRNANSVALGPQARSYAFAHLDGDSTRLVVGDSSGSHQVLAVRGRPRNFAFSRGGHILVAVTREPGGTGADSVNVAYAIRLDDRLRAIGAPKVTVRSGAGGNFTSPIFSQNGRMLAIGVERSGARDRQVEVLLSSVNDKTGDVGTPRRIEMPRPAAEWDDIAWTRDNKYLLLLTFAPTTGRSMLWRVSPGGNGAPVNIAENEGNLFWSFTLSQDGSHVAYQADLPARTTIWRVDLPPGTVR
jgi:hypothetical protein